MPQLSLGSVPATGVYVGGRLATGLYLGSERIWPAVAGANYLRPGHVEFLPRPLALAVGNSIQMPRGALAFSGRPLLFATSDAAIVALNRGSVVLTGKPLAATAAAAVAAHPGALTLASRPLATSVSANVTLPAAPGSFALAGQLLDFGAGTSFATTLHAGSLQLLPQGLAVTATRTATVALGTGTLALSSAVLSVRATTSVQLGPGHVTFIPTGLAATAAAASTLGHGAVALAGKPLAFSNAAGATVALGVGHVSLGGATLTVSTGGTGLSVVASPSVSAKSLTSSGGVIAALTVQVGDQIVVTLVSAGGSSTAINAITDTAGNTYTAGANYATTGSGGASHQHIATFLATAATAGAISVTATPTTSTVLDGVVYQLRGGTLTADTTDAVSGQQATNGATAPYTSPAMTVAQRCFVVAIADRYQYGNHTDNVTITGSGITLTSDFTSTIHSNTSNVFSHALLTTAPSGVSATANAAASGGNSCATILLAPFTY